MQMDIDAIREYLPHRYPFLLVDRVDELVPGERIAGRKNVSINEPFFAGHFPSHPIMPGVLLVEAMAQLCGILAFKTSGHRPDEGYLHYLAGLNDVRFKRPVRPGDTLMLSGTITGSRRDLAKFDCESRVDGEVACSARLLCVEREVTS